MVKLLTTINTTNTDEGQEEARGSKLKSSGTLGLLMGTVTTSMSPPRHLTRNSENTRRVKMRSEGSATVLPMHTRCPYPNGSEANGSNAEELSSHLNTSWSPVQGAGVSPVRVELVRLGEVLLHPGGEAGVGDHHGACGDAVAAEHRVLLTAL